MRKNIDNNIITVSKKNSNEQKMAGIRKFTDDSDNQEDLDISFDWAKDSDDDGGGGGGDFFGNWMIDNNSGHNDPIVHNTTFDHNRQERAGDAPPPPLPPAEGLQSLEESLLLGETTMTGDDNEEHYEKDHWFDANMQLIGEEPFSLNFSDGSSLTFNHHNSGSTTGTDDNDTEKPSSTASLGLDMLGVADDDVDDGANHDNQKMIEMQEPERMKTIRFAPQIATDMEGGSDLGHMGGQGGRGGGFGPSTLLAANQGLSEGSLHSLDIFSGGNKHSNHSISMFDGSGSMTQSSYNDEDDDDDTFASAGSEEDDPDKKIKRQMVFALGGVGLMALVGFGFKKIMNAFSKNEDVDGGADVTNAVDAADAAANINDAATLAASGGGDGGTSSAAAAAAAQEATNQAAFHASASQSQVGVGAFGFGGAETAATQGLSAAQTQVLQGMAVNAATNAATSAASASTALASTAATAAGVATAGALGAGAAAAATLTTAVSFFGLFVSLYTRSRL